MFDLLRDGRLVNIRKRDLLLRRERLSTDPRNKEDGKHDALLAYDGLRLDGVHFTHHLRSALHHIHLPLDNRRSH